MRTTKIVLFAICYYATTALETTGTLETTAATPLMEIHTPQHINQVKLPQKRKTQQKMMTVKQPSNYVLEQHGMMLKEQKRLMMFNNFDIISVILHVASPVDIKQNGLPEECNKQNHMREVKNNLKQHLNDIIKSISQKVEAAIEVHNDALAFLPKYPGEGYNCSSGHQWSVRGKKKRFLGIINSVLSVIGFTKSAHNSKNIELISNHIDTIDKQLNEIASVTEATVKLQKYQMTFHRKLIQIIHTQTDRLNITLTNMECDMHVLRYEYIALQKIQTWVHNVNDILVHQLAGRIEGQLTPAVIPIELLKLIVKQHSAFQSTIYTTQPEMLYQNAYINFISMTSDLKRYHFTMLYPKLYSTSIRTLFRVYQVGFKMDNVTTCTRYQTPEYVVMKNDTLYPIDVTKCTEKPGLTLCDASIQMSATKSCINRNYVHCKTVEIPCINNTYIIDDAGVLLFTETAIQVVKRDQGISKAMKLEVLQKNTTTSTYFISWLQIRKIYLTDTILESPTLIPNHTRYDVPFYYSEVFNNTVFRQFKTKNVTQLTDNLRLQQNILDGVNEKLGRIPPLLLSKQHIGPYTILAIIGAAIAGIAILVVTLYCVYRQRMTMIAGLRQVATHGTTEDPTTRQLIRYIIQDSTDTAKVAGTDLPPTEEMQRVSTQDTQDYPKKPVRVMYYHDY